MLQASHGDVDMFPYDGIPPCVVLVGAIGAGKTCLAQVLAYGETLGSLPTTAPLCYNLPGFVLWDTPGDDRFSWTCEPLLKRADLVLYCVACSDPSSGETPEEPSRLDTYRRLYAGPVVVVRTKLDLVLHSEEDLPADAPCAMGAGEFACSALFGHGIADLQDFLAAQAAQLRQAQCQTQTHKPPQRRPKADKAECC